MNSNKHKQTLGQQVLGCLVAGTVMTSHFVIASAQTTATRVVPKPKTATSSQAVLLHTKFVHTEINSKNKLLSTESGFVFQGTMYIPIWYVMQDLKKMNIASTWDGRHWLITLPKGWTALATIGQKPRPGNIEIVMNGHTVLGAPDAFAVPPGSKQVSAFIPIWYVMQALDTAGFHSAWSGKAWTLTPPIPGNFGNPGTSNTGGSGNPGTGGTGGSTPPTSSKGTGGTTSTPTSPPPPPVSTVPQAGPGQVTKESFAVGLFQALNILPQSGGSSYSDVSPSNPNASYVTAAANDGILPADSGTLYGVADQVTVAQADAAVWAALGISHAIDEPGGSPSRWGSVVNLSPTGLSTSEPLTETAAQSFLQNLHILQQGYSVDSGNLLHVAYPVADEYNATFSQMPANVMNTLYATPSAVQSAITQTYQFFNELTANLEGTDVVISLPNPMGSLWFASAVSIGTLQYSLNGGNTWTSVTVLDTRNLTEQGLSGGSTLLLKAPADAGVAIAYNQLAPATQGAGSSVVLGELQIQNSNGTWTVQRINVNG